MRSRARRSAALVLASLLCVVPAASSRAELAPGGVVTHASREQARALLPEDLFPFVAEAFPELEMRVVESADYTPHAKYVEATVKYACQPALDEKGNLLHYTAGQPFPYSEWAKEATRHACDLSPDDPQLGLKLAWNVNYRWQGGSGLNLPHWGFSNMRNSGKETWRVAEGEYRRTYFSARADLLPAAHELEPGTDVEWAEFFDVKTPFDLRGTMFLLYRYVTSGKEDDTWAYIPALRRVRRIAATQKSDSLLGTEFALEDFYGFSGYVWEQTWEARGERTLLVPLASVRSCFPSNLGDDERTRVSGMSRLGTTEEWKTCRFGPYGALAFAGESFERRTVVELDDVPRRPGHPYSRKKLWYDKETLAPVYAMMFDRSGKPYKILNHVFRWSESAASPTSQGARVPILSYTLLANVQNGISHVGQFDNSNAHGFGVAESRSYYDFTRLKNLGR